MRKTGTNQSERSSERDRIASARREAMQLVETGRPPPPKVDGVPGYQVLSRIGQGGMGEVYEARKLDPPRIVALKIIRGGGTVSEERRVLFSHEVETLARLNHPGIASIYDAGYTTDGRRFYTMELVRGLPLIEYARARHLRVRERLRLVRRVCEAVHYAHRRLVAHHDLKPSNIIVDGEGNPKVVDFGLARFAEADGSVRDPLSKSEWAAGTLPYMSPEQTRGVVEAADLFATDVYAMGVVLYELLTGQLPYDLADLDPAEARRVIATEVPRRPSTHDRSLRGDIDDVVMRALAKDPALRYGSIAALGEDIDRLLSRHPIQARERSDAQVLRKLLARHRIAAAFVGTLVALVAVFGFEIGDLYIKLAVERAVGTERDRQVGVQHDRQLRQAIDYERQASSLIEKGDFAAAIEPLRQCVYLRRAVLLLRDAPTGEALGRLGECLTKAGRYDEAERSLLDGYRYIHEECGEQSEQTRRAAARLAKFYDVWGKPELAGEWHERSRAQPQQQGTTP